MHRLLLMLPLVAYLFGCATFLDDAIAFTNSVNVEASRYNTQLSKDYVTADKRCLWKDDGTAVTDPIDVQKACRARVKQAFASATTAYETFYATSTAVGSSLRLAQASVTVGQTPNAATIAALIGRILDAEQRFLSAYEAFHDAFAPPPSLPAPSSPPAPTPAPTPTAAPARREGSS